MSGHTATPWRTHISEVRGHLCVVAGEGRPYTTWVCGEIYNAQGDMPRAEAEANAAFIVAACNSHADLVRALEPFVKIADDYDRAHAERVRHYADEGRDFGPPQPDHYLVSVSIGDCRKARAALDAQPTRDGVEGEGVTLIDTGHLRQSAPPKPTRDGAEGAGEANLREAWSGFQMIRETIETLGPVGSLPASEHLAGPTFTHEAEALVTGICKIASAPPKPAPDAMREALDARQRLVIEWGKRCFGADHMSDKIVRAARFFEEAAELVQAIGLPRDHALRVFDHVYSRPAGTPAQEAGGVANTLMALCGALDLSLDECQQAEIDRCLAKDPAHFAKRNEAKLREVDTLSAPVPPADGAGELEADKPPHHPP